MRCIRLIPLLVFLQCAIASADFPREWEGDYAGWCYETDGGDMPLRLHITPTTTNAPPAVTIDAPAGKAYGLAIDEVSVDGPRLILRRKASNGVQWTYLLVRDGNDFRGQLEIGDTSAMRVQLHKSARPLSREAETRSDAAGCYRFEDGSALWIWARPWGELEYYHSGTARQGTLFALGADRYFAGGAAYVPTVSDAEINIPRVEGSPAPLLEWTPAGGTTLQARRIDIAQRELEAKSGDAVLRGTLLMPPSPRPLGAVVLVGGSDWAVRASTLAEARLFLSMGMAALIYDRRGCGQSTGEELCTFSQSADDVLAMVQAVREQPEIRKDAVGLSGRSRGGWTAPLAASRGDVAFVVMISGAAVSPLRTQVIHRINQMREAGYDEASCRAGMSYLDLLWQSEKSDADWARYAAERERIIERGWWKFLAGPDTRDSSVYKWQVLNYRYEPREALSRLQCPLLALYGEFDDNITPAENVPALRDATTALPKDQVTIVVLPGADHGLRQRDADYTQRTRLHLRSGWVGQFPQELKRWLAQRGFAPGSLTATN